MKKDSILIDGKRYPCEIVTTSNKTMRVSFKNGRFIIKQNPLLHHFISPQTVYQENERIFRRILSIKDNSYQYRTGEVINILGRKYLIMASLTTGIYGDSIYVNISKDTKKEVFNAAGKMILDYLTERTRYFHGRFFQDVPMPSVRIKIMKTRYGVYNVRENKITFSVYLAHYPHDIIDYVIVHELCHTKIRSHQKEFHQLCASILPNYKELRARIKEERYMAS